MRLSGIKLAGFKSFVDPSQLPLPSNLSGIVGPNGCGKSNLIDAVRWVLGETSQKQLRMQDSEDVIFNGSKTRKPVGRASVELSFDNSDGSMQGAFAAYTEIAVRRELTRDGNSQYYLNGRKCLKRDVTDLFLGTGLGGRNQYAIIEQGMVSRMIEARPEELRTWLEEAAGISKYKERRRETESRIRQTRENLSRLNDLRSELQVQLEKLKKQADNAEKYKKFKEEERKLKAEILLLKTRELRQQSSAHEQQINDAESHLARSRQVLTEAGALRQAAEQSRQRAQQDLEKRQSEVYAAEAQAAKSEQSLRHARELLNLKQKELQQLQQQIAELDRSEQNDAVRRAKASEALHSLQQQLVAAERGCEQAGAEGAKLDQLQDEMTQRWEQFQQRSEQPLAQTEAERVRLQGLDRAKVQLDARQQRLQKERDALDATPIQRSLFDVDAELARLKTEIASLRAKLEASESGLLDSRQTRRALDQALNQSRQSLQHARGKLASLETLQQAALRRDDESYQAWLRQQNLDAAPSLAERIKVETDWEAAVEHVLGQWLQAPVTEDLIGFSTSAWPRSGVTLIASDHGASHPGGDQLAHKVSGPGALQDLLHGVICARDGADLDAQLARLDPGQSLIGKDGVWRSRQWLRAPGQDQQGAGVIAREQAINGLREQVAQLGQTVAGQERELEQLRQQQVRLESEKQSTAQTLEQLKQRQAQRMAFRQAQGVRLDQIESRIESLNQELHELQQQAEQLGAEQSASRQRLEQLEKAEQALRAERAQIQQDLARSRQQAQQARQRLVEARSAEQRLRVEQASQQSSLRAIESASEQAGQRRAQVQDWLNQRDEELQQLRQPIADQQALLETARTTLEQAREALRDGRHRFERVHKALLSAQHSERDALAAKDAAQEGLQQSRIDFENLRARSQALSQQAREACAEAHLDADRLAQALSADAQTEQSEQQLSALGRRIDRLGAINLAAISELQQAQQRETYLNDQHADLSGAMDVLEQAIHKIDTETKERFKDTFERVNTVFKQRFPRLFGGGEAYLELTGQDLLDTGVRVMARPPGKRNSTIQMLSGGEKAMTAVALLLGLFELNPAPFCLMDEVDAPLDDANVARYCEVVREMSERVQFIIITHNKITMELAGQLHGVTMQEPGVSRLVSVDVEQAIDLTGENQTKETA